MNSNSGNGDKSNETTEVPLVVVHMLTYNHEKYLEKALNSILEQVIDFKLQIYISDDASKDGTNAICKAYEQKYPDIIRYKRFEKNIGAAANGQQNLIRCLNTRAPYIAILEGDDYWCNPHKLQKQVDLLKANRGKYSICFTDVNYVDDNGKVAIENFIAKYYREKGLADQADLLTYMPLPTQTVIFSSEDLNWSVPDDYNRIYNPDAYKFALLTIKKNALYIDEVTACYRMHAGGIMSGIGEIPRLKKTIQSLQFLMERPILKPETIKAVKLRIIALQVHILTMLVHGGEVSDYFREFLRYLQYSSKFVYFKGLGMQTRRFFRVTSSYLNSKISKA